MSKTLSVPIQNPFIVSRLSNRNVRQLHTHTSSFYPTRFRLTMTITRATRSHIVYLQSQDPSSASLTIAVIGFGKFGQFLSKTLIQSGHTVLAHSRSDHTDIARSLGVSFFMDPHDICEQRPDVVLLCTSIISTQQVLRSLPLHRFKRNTLFVDVLSVKEFPRNLLLQMLPPEFDILCTHPMFGPESARHGWTNLTFVYDKVRVGSEESRVSRCNRFLDIFGKQGCRMVEMACVEHDRYAAGSQFITHTMGRVLGKLGLTSTPINTKGYESLLNLVENTSGDSFELYYGLFMYNTNALEQLQRLDYAFESLRQQLFGNLHEVLRRQLFGKEQRLIQSVVPITSTLEVRPLPQKTSLLKSLRFHNGSPRPSDCAVGSLVSLNKTSNLRIAIIGFGNFGQFLAKTFVHQGHTVLAYSRSDCSDVAERLGVLFFCDKDDLCEQHPDVVLICTSIISTEQVLRSLPFQRLKRSTLFVDVLSVKEFAKNLFLQILPSNFDILCTHPMFGPESGRHGWRGLPLVFDKIRVGNDESKISRCNCFVDIFAKEGCRMVEMSCEEHDRHAAGSQFITHTVGRILEKLNLELTPINTKGYETLLNLLENTASDSFDLYYGLFMYNSNAMDQLQKFDMAFESLKKHLFGQLHAIVRKQLFGSSHALQISQLQDNAASLTPTKNSRL